MNTQPKLIALTFILCFDALGSQTGPIIREIVSTVDHNYCTTRQFQHKTFCYEGIWFVFYSDGQNFQYHTSDDSGKTLLRTHQPVDQAPNGSSSFDVLKLGLI